MRSFFTLMFAVALLFSSFADVAVAGSKCTTSDLCEAYHNGQGGVKPPVADMVCVTFVQAGTDKVVLSFYDSYDPKNPSGPENHAIRVLPKVAGANGKFCVGHQWFDEAEWIMICNGHNYYDLRLSTAQDQIASGTIYTCLLGAEGCPPLL